MPASKTKYVGEIWPLFVKKSTFKKSLEMFERTCAKIQNNRTGLVKYLPQNGFSSLLMS